MLTTTPIHVSSPKYLLSERLFLYFLIPIFQQIVFSALFAGIIFFMTGKIRRNLLVLIKSILTRLIVSDQPIELDRFIKFTSVYILTTMVADGIGLMLGSILNPVVRMQF